MATGVAALFLGCGVDVGGGFTFRRFSGELGVEAERVIWFAGCRLERGLELSPVQLLMGGGGTGARNEKTR